jgi:POT family proton-dependent oligopeptide transporter
MSMAMAYGAGIQKLVYSRGPCFDHPLHCPGSIGGTVPNDVGVWVQTPLYFILAVAEILGFVTAWEYAYSKAPKNMKALVQSLTQLTACIASAIGIGISPAAKDPDLVYFYAILGSATAGISVPFWLLFRKYDAIDEDLNRMGH